jgi:hypothetical protein
MKPWLYVIIALWAGAIGFGMQRVWTYSTTPGSATAPPVRWPGSAELAPRAGEPVLMMFVHPQCPCTRASLHELQVIMERARQRPAAWVLITRPRDMPEGWEQTATWKMAQEIPGVRVRVDVDSVEARRFGAETSGHVILYDRRGAVFSGGITSGRGHTGMNDAERQVIALLDGGPVKGEAFPVFGCKLYGGTEPQIEET